MNKISKGILETAFRKEMLSQERLIDGFIGNVNPMSPNVHLLVGFLKQLQNETLAYLRLECSSQSYFLCFPGDPSFAAGKSFMRKSLGFFWNEERIH